MGDHLRKYLASRERQAAVKRVKQNNYANTLMRQHEDRIQKEIDSKFTKNEFCINKDLLKKLHVIDDNTDVSKFVQ